MAEYNPSKIIKDGNTYNFRDDTKIPLAGSNQISGSLIPSTDNSIDIGSSTKNLKMLYTKGITIDAKTIDTDANGNMTYDGHIVDTIEEQGNGYIRYSSGLQICWGKVTNNNSLKTGVTRHSFPRAFTVALCLVATPYTQAEDGLYTITLIIENGTTFVINSWENYVTPSALTINPLDSYYVAIGKWK